MKKRIFASIFLSSIILTTVAAPSIAVADTYDDQISQKNSEISDLVDQQTSTQTKIDTLESQVTTINAKSDEVVAQQKVLAAESKQLKQEIADLEVRIEKRTETMKNQARDVQVNGQDTSFVDAVLNADSLSDAVSRVQAVNTFIKANNTLIEQQKEDQEAVKAKEAANSEKIESYQKYQVQLDTQKKELQATQAELAVLKTSLAIQQATKEDEKEALVKQKAEAEAEQKRILAAQAAEAAAKKAAEQAEAKAKEEAEAKAAEQAKAQSDATTTSTTESTVTESNTATSTSKATTTSTVASSPQATTSSSTSTSSVSTTTQVTDTSNTYPVGQCTWFVKNRATWVGNRWGNANQWPASARANGFRVDNSPEVGSVVVFLNGAQYSDATYGHVGYVISVANGVITIEEGNYAGQSYNVRQITTEGTVFIHQN
ncbi:CHAP domain-containing protein [Enterococcus italicus]|uniref:PcsB-like coiled-coil domain-containing protein n=1 Tax=Enterococcus italicus TaxID=246144 RepID=UPI002073F2F0|nr:CHAP domain-containing protein [Enterococcus italicus]MCM6931623.1 CHAP domain-containing protein [Enterococcus italicus]